MICKDKENYIVQSLRSQNTVSNEILLKRTLELCYSDLVENS